MQKEYSNKAILKAEKQKFVFTEYGEVIEASSQEEAQKILLEKLSKK